MDIAGTRTPPTTNLSPWRYSISTLMVATAFIAWLAWFFSWSWDADERIVLATWLACVLLCILVGRNGRFRGLVAAAAVGGIVPATVFWLSHALELGFGLGTRADAFRILALLSIVCGGGIAAVLTAAMIRLYGDLCPAMRKRFNMIAICLLAVGLSARIAWVIHHDRTSWKPAFKVSDFISSLPNGRSLALSLSDDGSLLAVAAPFLDNGKRQKARLRLWDVASARERASLDLSGTFVQSLCFAPDASKIAVVHGANEGVCVYETETGRLVKFLDVSASSPWSTNNCCYSGDGKKLAVCNYDVDDRAFTVQMWRTDTWEPVCKHRVEGLVQLFATAQRPVLLIGDASAKLVDAESLKPLASRSINHHTLGRPLVSRDCKFVTMGHSLVDVETGHGRRLPAPIYCLAGRGRFVSRRCDMETHRYTMNPDFRLGVPFFRHWWTRGYTSGQAVLFDVFSGEEVCTSPNYATETFLDFQSSADGKTVVGQTWSGDSLYVWRVPE